MKEIGARLGITTRTVAFHKYCPMGKLGVRSTAELVKIAARHRLV
jgi:DNA-binding CsgD family transcriptional regulator